MLFIKKKDRSLYLSLCWLLWFQLHHKKNWYPLLLISKLLNSSYKACIYTKINFCYTYHLVYITEGNKWKTTSCTYYRSFEWSVILFDLTNASAIFQYFMNDIFSDLLDIYVVIYLDDILIYSNDMANHTQHIKSLKYFPLLSSPWPMTNQNHLRLVQTKKSQRYI